MRRITTFIGLLLLAAFVTSGTTAAAGDDSEDNPIHARVVASNPGPLHACPALPCHTFLYVFVRNENEIGPDTFGASRDSVAGALVVSGVDMVVTIDGAPALTLALTPPPNPFIPPFAGRWPMTVTCGGNPPPCNTVGSPAVLPGENTVIVYPGWGHDPSEPDGTYVFTFTVHGTINGVATSVSARIKIVMER